MLPIFLVEEAMHIYIAFGNTKCNANEGRC